jgi:hypothetical protein
MIGAGVRENSQPTSVFGNETLGFELLNWSLAGLREEEDIPVFVSHAAGQGADKGDG